MVAEAVDVYAFETFIVEQVESEVLVFVWSLVFEQKAKAYLASRISIIPGVVL
jgi:hypothetical protein